MSPKQNFAFLQIKINSADEMQNFSQVLTLKRLESRDKVLIIGMLNYHRHLTTVGTLHLDACVCEYIYIYKYRIYAFHI